MRKLIVIATMCCLVAATAACSSSSKPSAASTTTGGPSTTVDAATLAKVCPAYKTFASTVKNVGSSPADFKVAATNLKAEAADITVSPPAGLATSAQALAAQMNTAATTLATATKRADAVHAIALLIFSGSSSSKAYASWWQTACQK